MKKKVTIFRKNGDVEIVEVNFIIEAVGKMDRCDYAHVPSPSRWVHKFKENKRLDRLDETYNYVDELLVPEEYRLKMVLMQWPVE